MGTLSLMYWRAIPWSWTVERITAAPPISMQVKSLVAGSLLFWAFLLPWTQPEQQLRRAVERDLRAGEYRQAFVTMSAHRREEFPPFWDPPPHIGSKVERSRIVDTVAALTGAEATWVRSVFIEKLDAALGGNSFPMETIWLESNVLEILSLLNRIPEGPRILKDRLDLLLLAHSYISTSRRT